MHAQNWNNRQDLTGWWLSEKMDGIRAYWDGRRLLSRKGNRIPVPPSFTIGLPKIPLDGELWLGRKSLEKLRVIHNTVDSDWSEVKYVVFDLPSSKEPLENRLNSLKQLELPLHVKIADFKRCEGP